MWQRYRALPPPRQSSQLQVLRKARDCDSERRSTELTWTSIIRITMEFKHLWWNYEISEALCIKFIYFWMIIITGVHFWRNLFCLRFRDRGYQPVTCFLRRKTCGNLYCHIFFTPVRALSLLSVVFDRLIYRQNICKVRALHRNSSSCLGRWAES